MSGGAACACEDPRVEALRPGRECACKVDPCVCGDRARPPPGAETPCACDERPDPRRDPRADLPRDCACAGAQKPPGGGHNLEASFQHARLALDRGLMTPEVSQWVARQRLRRTFRTEQAPVLLPYALVARCGSLYGERRPPRSYVDVCRIPWAPAAPGTAVQTVEPPQTLLPAWHPVWLAPPRPPLRETCCFEAVREDDASADDREPVAPRGGGEACSTPVRVPVAAAVQRPCPEDELDQTARDDTRVIDAPPGQRGKGSQPEVPITKCPCWCQPKETDTVDQPGSGPPRQPREPRRPPGLRDPFRPTRVYVPPDAPFPPLGPICPGPIWQQTSLVLRGPRSVYPPVGDLFSLVRDTACEQAVLVVDGHEKLPDAFLLHLASEEFDPRAERGGDAVAAVSRTEGRRPLAQTLDAGAGTAPEATRGVEGPALELPAGRLGRRQP